MRKTLALILLASALVGCDNSNSQPDSEAPKAEEPQPAPKPFLTVGADTFEGVPVLDWLPADGLDLLVGAANASELGTALKVEPPNDDEGIRAGIPVVGDLHPDVMNAVGLDPNGPIGFGRYRPFAAPSSEVTGTSRWFVYGKVADRKKLESLADRPDQVHTFVTEKAETPDAGLEKRAAMGEPLHVGNRGLDIYFTQDDQWVVLASTKFSELPNPKSIAKDSEFTARRGDLKYGSFLTAYLPGEDPLIVGFSPESAGLGMKSVATDDAVGKTAAVALAERLVELELLKVRHYGLMGLLAAPSNEKLKELEAELEEAEAAPEVRQKAALRDTVAGLEHDEGPAGSAAHERIYGEGVAIFGAAHKAWIDAGITEAEQKAIDKLKQRIKAEEQKASAEMFGSMFKASDMDENLFKSLGSSSDNVWGKGLQGGMGGLGTKGMGGGIGVGGGGRGGGGTLGGIGGLGKGYGGRSKSTSVSISGSGEAANYAKRKSSRLKRCFKPGSEDASESVSATLKAGNDGAVSVSGVSGGDAALQSCVKRALGGTGSAMDGSVTVKFVYK